MGMEEMTVKEVGHFFTFCPLYSPEFLCGALAILEL